MSNETNFADVAPDERDMRVTRLPFDNAEEVGWLGQTSLWALAEPIYTPFGDEVGHLVVSSVETGDSTEDGGPETVVFGATEEGSMYLIAGLIPPPPVAVREGILDAATVLADLGFVDVTEGAAA